METVKEVAGQSWPAMSRVETECNALRDILLKLAGLARKAAGGGSALYTDHMKRTIRGYARRVHNDAVLLCSLIEGAVKNGPAEPNDNGASA